MGEDLHFLCCILNISNISCNPLNMYNFSHTKAVLSNKTSQELRVLSRSLSDCHSLTLNVMILSVSLSLSEGSTIALKCSEDAKFKMSVTELLTDNVTY